MAVFFPASCEHEHTISVQFDELEKIQIFQI